MKTIESTKIIWILLCSIIVSSVATEHGSSHRYGSSDHDATSPRKKTQNPAVTDAIQMPEKVMSNREVSCISSDSNIFEIMNDAKKSCRGNDMICTFYMFANLKYYNIGSLDINKALFDKLLMKYDNWLLTAEKIAEKDTEMFTKRDEKYRVKQKELTQSDISFTEENNYNIDTNDFENEAINDYLNFNKEYTPHIKHRNRAHNTDNGHKRMNLKENNGKYIELLPKYDKEHKYFEVFLPEDKRRGKPRTINVNIHNENEYPTGVEKDIYAIPNVPMRDELQKVPTLGNYDLTYKNHRVGHNPDSLTTNIREYNTEYLNENSYHHQREPKHKVSHKSKPKPFQQTEGTNSIINNVIPTDEYLGQSQEIHNYIDNNNGNNQNDKWIVDINMGDISPGNAPRILTHNINLENSSQNIDSSTNTYNRDHNPASNNALEEILKPSRYNDKVTALNENTNTLVHTNIISPDITEHFHSNNKNIERSANAHEKHNLTPSHNKTKHMHDLVDQATLNDDFHTLEYTNIYNDHDFDDTHLSVHDNSTQKTSNIHLNEPVFITLDSFRENQLETSPFVIAVPKFHHQDHDDQHKASDYIGTQIDIVTPENKSDVSDKSAKTLPHSHTTSIPETVVPETVLPDTILNSESNFILSNFTSPEDVAASTNTLRNSDLDLSSIVPNATPEFVPNTETQDAPIVALAPVASENEICLESTPDSNSITEGNSVLVPNETTISIDKSSITSNFNVLEPTLVNTDTSSQIEHDVLAESNWHVEDSGSFVTDPLTRKADVKFQQKPQKYSTKPTESSTLDFDVIPGTLSKRVSAKLIHKNLINKLDNSFIAEPYTEPDISIQYEDPTSVSTTSGSKAKPLLVSETIPYLDENLSKSTEQIPFNPPEFTSIAENDLLEPAHLTPSVTQDQLRRVNQISQHKSPFVTNILSDVDLQNHVSTEELNYLAAGNIKPEQVEPLLGPASLSKAKKPLHMLNNLPSKHKPLTSLSSPIPPSNYMPLTETDMTNLPPSLYSGIPHPKCTTPLPNKDFLAIPSLKPYYSKIPHIPTSTNQPLLNKISIHKSKPTLDQYTSIDGIPQSSEELLNLPSTPFTESKLSQKAPLVLDNESVLTALNNFAKSTKSNPLYEEDFQRLTKDLPTDLNNLFVPQFSPVDSGPKLITTNPIIPSINKISKHKTKPASDQYTSIDEMAQSSPELINMPSTTFSGSKLAEKQPLVIDNENVLTALNDFAKSTKANPLHGEDYQRFVKELPSDLNNLILPQSSPVDSGPKLITTNPIIPTINKISKYKIKPALDQFASIDGTPQSSEELINLPSTPFTGSKLAPKQPLLLDNDSVLTALNNFAKSTKVNPLHEEDYQRLIKDLPTDLNNLILPESSPVDSELNIKTTDSIIPSINKISKHKTKPVLDKYTSIDGIPQSSEELLNLQSTPFTESKLAQKSSLLLDNDRVLSALNNFAKSTKTNPLHEEDFQGLIKDLPTDLNNLFVPQSSPVDSGPKFVTTNPSIESINKILKHKTKPDLDQYTNIDGIPQSSEELINLPSVQFLGSKLAQKQPLVLDNDSVLTTLNNFAKSTKTNPLHEEDFQGLIKDLPSDLNNLIVPQSSPVDSGPKLITTNPIIPSINKISKYKTKSALDQFASIDGTPQSSEELINLPSTPFTGSKLAPEQPLLLDNDSVLTALNNFAKSTKANPLHEEDYQRLIKDLPTDLNNLILPESSPVDSELIIQTIDSIIPYSINKISKHKIKPALNQFTSTDEAAQSSPELINLPSTTLPGSKLQKTTPKIQYIKPITQEQFSNEESDSSKMIPELDKDSFSILQPMQTEYSEIKPEPTESLTYASTTPSVPTSVDQDLSLPTESTATSPHIENIPIEIGPVQPNKSPKVVTVSGVTSQKDTAGKTLPESVFEHGFESSQPSDISQYEISIPSTSLNSKSPRVCVDSLSPLKKLISETQTDNLLYNPKTIPSFEERETPLNNFISEPLNPDLTETKIQLTPVTYKPSPKIPSSSVVSEDTPISTMDSTPLSSTPTPLPAAKLLPSLRLPATYNPRQFSTDSIINNLRQSDDLDNLNFDPKCMLINQLDLPVSKLSPGLSMPSSETLMFQDSLQDYIPHYTTMLPSDINPDINQYEFPSASLIHSNSPLLPLRPTLTNIIPLLEPKLQTQLPINLQSPSIPPSASISHIDQLDLLKPSFDSTKLDADSSFIPNDEPSFEYISKPPGHLSKSIPKLPFSPFYTTTPPVPFSQLIYSPVLNKSKSTVPYNDLLFTPNNLAHQSAKSNLPKAVSKIYYPKNSNDIKPYLNENMSHLINDISTFHFTQTSEASPFTTQDRNVCEDEILSSLELPISPMISTKSKPNRFATSSLKDSDISLINYTSVMTPLQKPLLSPALAAQNYVSELSLPVDRYLPYEDISICLSNVNPSLSESEIPLPPLSSRLLDSNRFPNTVSPLEYKPYKNEEITQNIPSQLISEVSETLSQDYSQLLEKVSSPHLKPTRPAVATLTSYSSLPYLNPQYSWNYPQNMLYQLQQPTDFKFLKDSSKLSPIPVFSRPMGAEFSQPLFDESLYNPSSKLPAAKSHIDINIPKLKPLEDVSIDLSNVNPSLSESEISLPSFSSRLLDSNLTPNTVSPLEYKPYKSEEITQDIPSQLISDVSEILSQDYSPPLEKVSSPHIKLTRPAVATPTSYSSLSYLNPQYSWNYPQKMPYQLQQPRDFKFLKESSKLSPLPGYSRQMGAEFSQPIMEESLYNPSKLPPTMSYMETNIVNLKPQIISQLPSYSAPERDVLPTSTMSLITPQSNLLRYPPKPSSFLKPLDLQNFIPMDSQYQYMPHIIETKQSISKPKLDTKLKFSSIPSLPLTAGPPVDVNLPMISITPECSVQYPTLSSHQTKPHQKKFSPLQFLPSSSSPVYFEPEYITPTTPMRPLKAYPSSSPPYFKPSPVTKSNPIPVQPNSKKLFSGYTIPSYTTPNIPRSEHSITPSQVSAKSISNSVPLLPANGFSADFTNLSPSYNSVSPYSSVSAYPKSIPPCKLSKLPSNLYSPEYPTPASFVEALWSPSLKKTLRQPSASTSLSPISQYSTPTDILRPMSPTYTKPFIPATTLPSLSSSHMRPLTQNPLEYMSPKHISPTSPTNTHPSISYPSITPSNKRSNTSSVSYIHTLLNSQAKRPISKSLSTPTLSSTPSSKSPAISTQPASMMTPLPESGYSLQQYPHKLLPLQKSTLDIPWEGTKSFVNEIKNIPFVSNMNQMKIFPTYRPQSISSISNLQMNQNDLENNMSDAVITPRADTIVSESLISGIPEPNSGAKICTDVIGMTNKFGKESKTESSLESLSNMLELDETTEMLLNKMLSPRSPMPNISTPTVCNIPLSETPHKKPNLISSNVLNLEESKDVLRNEDLKQGDYITYSPGEILSTGPKLRPYLTPWQSYTQSDVPAQIFSPNFAPIPSSPTLSSTPSSKSPVIPSQPASMITPLSETGYSLQQYPHKQQPLPKQPSPSCMLSLPYLLVPSTELLKLPTEQSTPKYTSASGDLNRIIDMISQQTPQLSRIPSTLHSFVPSQSNITPLLKAASPVSPLESYEANPPTYSLPWKQGWPTQSVPTAMNKNEVIITPYSHIQDASLPQTKSNIQPITPLEDLSHITLPNENPAIYSLTTVTPTELQTSSTTFEESENSLTIPVNINPSKALNAQILQNNKLYPLGNIPKYSNPIETVPYISNRPQFGLPTDFKMNTRNLSNQFKIPSTKPTTFQPKEVTEFYETAKPHLKLLPKEISDQLNAPVSSPLTYIEPETVKLNEYFKPHPKLLAALDRYTFSQSTADSSSIPDTIIPEPYLPPLPKYLPSVPFTGIPISSSSLLKPLINANFKSRSEIFYNIPKQVVSSSPLPSSTVEGFLDNTPSNSVDMTPSKQLYSSYLIKPLRKAMHSKEPSIQAEPSPNYMEYIPQSPLSVLDGQSLTKVPLLNSQLLKPLPTNFQKVLPNLRKYLEINPPKQPLISNYEQFTPSPIGYESLVTETPNIIEPSTTSSIPNTLQSSPLTNKYQSIVSMLPCNSQDTLQNSQPISIFNSPLKNMYPTPTPSWIKPPSDTRISKSPISQFMPPTYSPFMRVSNDSSRLKPLETYSTLTSKWKSGLPTSNITPIPITTNVLPNQYLSYLQYKILDSLPTPVTETKTLEIANYKEETTPYTWSSTTPRLTSAALTSLDPTINENTEPRTTFSDLKSSYPPLFTSTLPKPKEISQASLRFSNLNVFNTLSSVPDESKFAESPDLPWIYSPSKPISGVPISQSSSQALPPNIVQYLPLLNYEETQPVSVTDKLTPVSSKQNTASYTSPLLIPGNWLQRPIITKFPQFYETPFKKEIIPQNEYAQIIPNKVPSSNIVTSNIGTPKDITNIQDELKYTLNEEPLEFNSVKTVKPITTKGPNIKYKYLDTMDIAPNLAEFPSDIPNKTFIKSRSQSPMQIGPETEVSYDKYQNIESIKPLINQMPEISQYLPSPKISRIASYSSYTSPTNYYSKTTKTNIPATPDISKITPLTSISMNPESISEYTNSYSNNHIGNIPKLFKIPTTISNTNVLPINSVSSEICNDLTNNIIEYVDTMPKLEQTPQNLNGIKTISPVETPYRTYNTETMLTPCLKSNPKYSSYISPMSICETSTEQTENPCQPTTFVPDSTIKYRGYKTYYPATNILQSPSKSQPFSPIQYQNQILNTPIKPCQTKLYLDNILQRLKFDDSKIVEGVHDKEIDKELKSIIINYIKSKEDFKTNLFNNDGELVIPLGDLAINKKEASNYKTIDTNNPSIGLKVWKSNAKIVTAELKLKFKELSVTNFMPVVNNLNQFDDEEIRKIIKEYIDQKYGNHIEIHEPYTVDNQYVVLKDFDHKSYDNKFNLLWPTEYV